MLRPKFEVTFSVTVRDAGPEDVSALLGQLQQIAGREAIQVSGPVPTVAGLLSAEAGKVPALLPASFKGLRALRRLDPAEKKAMVLKALQDEQWSLVQAARRLGIASQTLRNWIADLGIKVPDLRDM